MLRTTPMALTKLTILFSGMIAADPHQGGATWAVLQYVLGLRSLGHEVVFVEPVKTKALRPMDCPLHDTVNAKYFHQVMSELDLASSSALLLEGTRQSIGLPYEQLHDFASGADVLLNVSGMLADPELIGKIPLRGYLDLDPAFIQLWHAAQGIDMRLDAHTHFVTVGLAIGTPSCRVPTCGRQWITTLQPVVLAHWPPAHDIRYYGLTTVGNWRGYGSIEHNGIFYGQKAHSLREFITLPRHTDEKFLLALAIHPDEASDLEALSQNGWQILNPLEVARTPCRYRDFIQHSKGELGIAKSGYVKAACGWFSDRSACYLASGRPVIAQETGFSRYLPVGEGLFAFVTMDDAVRSIEAMNSDYAHHSQAARKLAETYFQSDQVLTNLLQRIGAIA